jgi:hypothetical protein
MSQAGVQPEVASSAPGARSFVQRALGAARLDSAAYDEIGQSPNALGQAAAVVALAAVARAFASAQLGTTVGALFGAVTIVSAWLLGATLIWIGSRQQAPYSLLLRTVGFAMAPLILVVLDVVPVAPVRYAVDLLATALFVAALVVGTRQALRTSTGVAALLCAPVLILVIFLPFFIGYLASLVGI